MHFVSRPGDSPLTANGLREKTFIDRVVDGGVAAVAVSAKTAGILSIGISSPW